MISTPLLSPSIHLRIVPGLGQSGAACMTTALAFATVTGGDGGRDGGGCCTTGLSLSCPFRFAASAYERFVLMTVMTGPVLS